MKILIVVDMQRDFVDGALGSEAAKAIVPRVKDKIEEYESRKEQILFTRDTHQENYLETQEGRNLPVPHCIQGSHGWQILPGLHSSRHAKVDKVTFGSSELPQVLAQNFDPSEIESIELIGLCTDICVISNAMVLKAFFPEVPIIVDSSCCAGVSEQTHLNALEAMKVCQIQVI